MSEPDISIWILEDHEVFRNSISRALNALEGICCTRTFGTAEELEEAMIDPEIVHPNILLLDVQLPGKDGISALAGIQEKMPDVQPVILTAFDDPHKIVRAVKAGAAGYILKSSSIDEIGEAIHQYARGGAPMSPSVARMLWSAISGARRKEKRESYDLTQRELDILHLLADGKIKKEIALHLEISVHTVSTHIRSIYEKLAVNTNTGAVAKALREDLI